MELVVTSDSRGMRLGYESSVVVKVGDDGSLGGGECEVGGVVEGKVVRSTERVDLRSAGPGGSSHSHYYNYNNKYRETVAKVPTNARLICI